MKPEELKLNGEKIRALIELTEPMLGTIPKNPDIYARFVASKAPGVTKDENGNYIYPDEVKEEIASVPEVDLDSIEADSWTGFFQSEKGVYLYNYMMLGQIKAGLENLIENQAIKKIPAYKKWADRLIVVNPRKVFFLTPDGKIIKEPDDYIERPLRAMTAKGERITVVRSDIVLAGRQLLFEVEILHNSKGLNADTITKALQFGAYYGLGQWRGSGGFGTFRVIDIEMLSQRKPQ